MNDILEILDIVKGLGGSATIDEIVKGYCLKYNMIMQSQYSTTVCETLKKNPDKVVFDTTLGEWCIHKEKQSSGWNSEYIEGSPQWFFENSKKEEFKNREEKRKTLRKQFVDRYSKDKLMSMNGGELLKNVFADDSSMLYLLTMDEDYKMFGAGSKFPYLWPLRYFVSTGECLVYPKNKATSVEEGKEEEIAEETRDKIVKAVEMIETISPFDSVMDYEKLHWQIKTLYYGQFTWALKYYQMLFPEYFPGMYADHILRRAVRILGLKDNGKKRVINMGEISLFIRECGIDNITFGDVFGSYWTWEGNQGPSDYAKSLL